MMDFYPIPAVPLTCSEKHSAARDATIRDAIPEQMLEVPGLEHVRSPSENQASETVSKRSKTKAEDIGSQIDWDSIRGLFERLYKTEGRNLTDTMDILEREHGFRASRRSFKYHIKEWDIWKKPRLNSKHRISKSTPLPRLTNQQSNFGTDSGNTAAHAQLSPRHSNGVDDSEEHAEAMKESRSFIPRTDPIESDNYQDEPYDSDAPASAPSDQRRERETPCPPSPMVVRPDDEVQNDQDTLPSGTIIENSGPHERSLSLSFSRSRSRSPFDNPHPSILRSGNISSHSSTSSVHDRSYITMPVNPDRAPTSAADHLGSTQKTPAMFECTLCPKRFTRAYNLRAHLRTHTDERPFVCTMCGKAFARQNDRKRHECLHSGEKKFTCRGELRNGGQWGCGRRFARADGIGRHFQSDAGRACAKPLYDEEAAEKQRLHREQTWAQQQASGRQRQALMMVPMPGLRPGIAPLPAPLLAQYPALEGIQWDLWDQMVQGL